MAAASESRSSIWFMLLSAALFGYLGFTTTWNYTGANGEFLLFVALLDWTLKISAIAFVASAAVTLAQPMVGSVMFAVCGLVSAIMFAVVALLDFLDTQHTAFPPFLLILFAIWNGAGSWMGLRELLASRRAATAPQ